MLLAISKTRTKSAPDGPVEPKKSEKKVKHLFSQEKLTQGQPTVAYGKNQHSRTYSFREMCTILDPPLFGGFRPNLPYYSPQLGFYGRYNLFMFY